MTDAKSQLKPAVELANGLAAEKRLGWLSAVRAKLPQAEWYLVGGAVRDLLVGRTAQDFDFVVRLVGLGELTAVLEKFGRVDLVGRNFGVLKFRPEGMEEQFDIAWPRTERAGGSGAYRDFLVQSDPELPLERDLARRDFTVNALAWDFQANRLVDEYGGLADLSAGLIRAVGEPAARFAEDYSRLLRCVRFACQLDFRIDEATWAAVLSLVPHLDDVRASVDGEQEAVRVVPYETVAREFLKAMAADPGRATDLLEASGALLRLIPDLAKLRGCQQSADHHAEGDVWTHTRLVLAKLHSPEFATLFPDERPAVETAVAALLHDIAKPRTVARDGDRWTFYGHEVIGETIARGVAERLRLASAPEFAVDAGRIGWLVRNHMFPNLVRVDEVKRTTLYRYFLTDRPVGRALLHLAAADALASLPPSGVPDLANLKRLLGVLGELTAPPGSETTPRRLLDGQEVMDLARLGPGPEVGRLLESLLEEQLQGRITTVEQAKRFIAKQAALLDN